MRLLDMVILISTWTLLMLASIQIFHIDPLAIAQVQQSSPAQIDIVLGSSSPTSPKFYDPPSLSITAGSEVKWMNRDTTPHTVTFTKVGLYDSGIIFPGNQVQHTFFDQGVLNYYCKIHPFMVGQIIVK